MEQARRLASGCRLKRKSRRESLRQSLTTARLLQEACEAIDASGSRWLGGNSFGEWEGAVVLGVRDLYWSLFRRWRGRSRRMVPPGGESFEDVLRRVGDGCMSFWRALFPHLFVCHGTIWAPSRFLKSPSFAGVCVSQLRSGRIDVWEISVARFLNDALHVRPGTRSSLPFRMTDALRAFSCTISETTTCFRRLGRKWQYER
jgi:broad specificity phosphatase PhoE